MTLSACGSGSSDQNADAKATQPTDKPSPKPTKAKVPEKRAGYVAKADLGREWPFAVDHVVVRCEAGDVLLVVTPNGRRLPLNGTAMAKYPDEADIRTFKTDDFHEFWLADPTDPEIKMSIEPIIERAEARCK